MSIVSLWFEGVTSSFRKFFKIYILDLFLNLLTVFKILVN